MQQPYKTRQRELILNYLIENRDAHITADNVADHLKSRGTPIGKATIYRYLDKLVEQNAVRKYPLGNGASACYQYVEETSGCMAHYHLMCVSCGKLIHMECKNLNDFFCHLQAEHSFKADPARTIVYGECSECGKHRACGEDCTGGTGCNSGKNKTCGCEKNASHGKEPALV